MPLREHRRYRGQRLPDGSVKVSVNGKKLAMRLDLFKHSPTGFEWGYEGSGPAQLALAILADALQNDKLAVRMHQPFKRAVIAKLERDEDWILTSEEVGMGCVGLSLKPWDDAEAAQE